ncbi:hypothetical protein [Undibacterium sp. Jales W-56]|nr:hypothetical protein [Undibacterium sp. Jales W-56]
MMRIDDALTDLAKDSPPKQAWFLEEFKIYPQSACGFQTDIAL